MECFENGLITEKETGGIKLNFGNAEGMIRMLEMIARRQGFGNVLAEGVMRAAKTIGKGAERYAIHVKGQEFPMHEPRAKSGLGIYYAVSPTGADHCGAAHDSMYERSGPPLQAAMALVGPVEPVSPYDVGTDKMRLITAQNHVQSLKNCIDICIFIPFSLDQTTELVSAITGWNVSLLELVKAGERATTLTRMFNVRQGFSADHDYLPERMFTGHTKGANADKPMDRNAVDNAIKTYYGIMGWNEDTGIPTKGKLRELGIEWAIDYLPA
jgi:aldehyde:ferredoxin oxidoreductase